ncbi:MAG: hypothetical protein WBN64_03940 [Candidatus Deferrimicrobium sp.]
MMNFVYLSPHFPPHYYRFCVGLREEGVNVLGLADRDGGLVALEVNLRPPGGLTTDMFNYANDIDIYREWARVVARNRFTAVASRPYHVGYVGRKRGKRYVHGPGEILAAFGGLIVHHESIDSWGHDVNHDWPWWRRQMPYFLGHLNL